MKIFFLLVFAFLKGNAYAQDSTKVWVNWGSNNTEMNELYSVLKIDPYLFKFSDKNLENRKFKMSYVEYRDGKLSAEHLFSNDAETEKRMTYNPLDSGFTIKAYAHKINTDSVEISFRFPRVGFNFQLTTLHRNDYSFRDATTTLGKNFSSIPIGRKVPILAYAIPYEDPKKPGRKFYCTLTANGVPPEKWGEVYGVKHYIIFYLEII